MLIALSGRKGSGKTTIVDLLVARGFKHLSFLEFFSKNYFVGDFVIDDFYNSDELNRLKNIGATCIFLLRPYYWEYANDYSQISLNRMYFDYVFLNDGSKHKLIRKFGFFIDRLLSNRHDSLPRYELVELLNKYNGNTSLCAKYLGCSRDKIVWSAVKHMLHINRNKYYLNHNAFSEITPQSAYWAGYLSADGTIKKHLTYDYLIEVGSLDIELIEGFINFLKTNKPIYKQLKHGKMFYSSTVSSPYMVDDLKMWDLEPRKSKYNKIPSCIKNNEELLCFWLVGLIDGDGSIYNVQQSNNIGITVLASKQIIDFIKEWLLIPGSVSQEKQIDNLYNIKFSGKNAVAVYNKIYKGVGLKRKWEKVVPFLDKKWGSHKSQCID